MLTEHFLSNNDIHIYIQSRHFTTEVKNRFFRQFLWKKLNNTACFIQKWVHFLNEYRVSIPLNKTVSCVHFKCFNTKNCLCGEIGPCTRPERNNVCLIDSVNAVYLKLYSGLWWCISSFATAFAVSRFIRMRTASALSFQQTMRCMERVYGAIPPFSTPINLKMQSKANDKNLVFIQILKSFFLKTYYRCNSLNKILFKR